MKNFCQVISEPTEKTERTEQRWQCRDLDAPPPGRSEKRHEWILYDGECRYCIAAAKQFSQVFGRRGFSFLPLQTRWVQQRLGLVPGEPLTEMRVLTADGRDFGGADAVLFLARQVWWLWPLSVVGRLPGMHRVVDATYRWIAAHRGCTHLKCDRADAFKSHFSRDETSSSLHSHIIPWAALIILPTLALMARPHGPPWAFMWAMAGAIFFGCKWLTFCRAVAPGSPARLWPSLAYLFLWAGMDAGAFLKPPDHRESPTSALPGIGQATLKIAIGMLLLFGLPRIAGNELLAGWIGMSGMILILHFGLFDLAAIFWRTFGFNAQPIMNAPLKATSVAEFWGRRWNGAFNQLILNIFFRRFARSFGAVRATLTAFLISGLIHELVISLPAGAGYGLPTSYFLLQGWGVIAQRTARSRNVWLQRDLASRAFTTLLVAAPAFWLFHPPFVHRVIIPFMQAINAL